MSAGSRVLLLTIGGALTVVFLAWALSTGPSHSQSAVPQPLWVEAPAAAAPKRALLPARQAPAAATAPPLQPEIVRAATEDEAEPVAEQLAAAPAPSTAPTQTGWAVESDDPQAAADRAQVALGQAKMRARDTARQTQWHRRLSGETAALAKKLNEARLKGTAKEKVAASTAWNKVRMELERREAEALARDSAVAKAEQELNAAVRALEEIAQAEAKRREEQRATAAAEAHARMFGSDDGPSYDDDYTGGGYSGGGEVRVRGYTRRDGTYVARHTRSRPDGIKSNNRSYKGGGRSYGGGRGGGRGR